MKKYVSPYYFQLYDIVRELIIDHEKYSDGVMIKEMPVESQEKGNKKTEIKQFKIDIQDYKELICQVRNFIFRTEN